MDYFNKLREKRSIRNTYNTSGFDAEGYHLNGTKYDYEGFDARGLNRHNETRQILASNKKNKKTQKNKKRHKSSMKNKRVVIHLAEEEVKKHKIPNQPLAQSIQQKLVIVEKLQQDVALSNETLSNNPPSLLEQKLVHLKKQAEKTQNVYNRHRILPPSGRLSGPFDEKGFNAFGMHRNGTPLDTEGFSKKGYDQHGFDRQGYNQKGLNERGQQKE